MASDKAIKFVLTADTKQAGTGVRSLSADFQKLQNQAVVTIEKMNTDRMFGKFKDIGGKFKEVGSGVSSLLGNMGMVGGAVGGALAFKSMVNGAMDFNQAMAKIASRIPGDKKKLSELSEGIKDLSMDSGKSTDELAESMLGLTQEFTDASAPELFARLKAGMNLSKISFTDTASSIDYLKRVSGEFGEGTPADMERVGALTFQAMKKADVSLEEFAGTMAGISPDAKSLGVGLDELMAVFSTMGDGAVQFGKTGAGMGLLLRTLANASPDVNKAEEDLSDLEKAVKKVGATSGRELIGKYGLIKAMQMLSGEAESSGKKLEDLIGGRGTIFAGRMKKEWGEMAVAMKNQANATKEANEAVASYDEVNASGKAWAKFTETLKVTGLELGEVTLPAVTGLLELLRGSVQFYRNWFKDVGEITDTASKMGGGNFVSQLWDELTDPSGKKANAEKNKKLGLKWGDKDYIYSSGEKSPQELRQEEERKERVQKQNQIEIRMLLPTDEEGNPVIDVKSTKNMLKKAGYPQIGNVGG
jgi:TP901 family phage tail tape measure protein